METEKAVRNPSDAQAALAVENVTKYTLSGFPGLSPAS
jgi:hypothetical protein